MNPSAYIRKAGLVLATMWGLTGCSLPQPQADAVRHFTLSSAVTGEPASNPAMVKPVWMAGHLRNRAMAVRVSENEIIYLEDVRWAEPLDEAITQLLRNRIRSIQGPAAVSVHIQRCELTKNEGNAIHFQASYEIVVPGKPTVSRNFTASPRTWEGRDHGVLVSQIRDAVGELGNALAATLEGK